ncbi:malonic semialdehyde reductase [Cellulomonas marina]|uniref:3-hydroxypropanoate dehydrogenase n=1 Tax=Cellulomonas marina TaxID=988821 RepID=A0A1I0XSK8_9CELL|nr:malonic semialdehyde reductase [Cellulomonas marina]GIG30035.1 putative NADH dehydrogenase/NAD(P)H nitroreductase [Cellulomonas marina]SFB03158.1 3-hydroxypropanoate dehydrogenase [Cellulomonas marina]
MTTDLGTLDDLDFPASRLAVDDDVADLLFRHARSAGAFTDEPVTDEDLEAVHDLAKWGPTALNTSPMRTLVVRSREGRERLAAHMAEGNRARVLAAPMALVVAADPAFHRHLPVLAPHMPGKADELEGAVEAREGMARTNTLLQAGYLTIALRAAGLAVGPMGGMDAAGIDAEFFAESGWRTVLVLLVGHAQGEGTHHPRAPRLTWEQVSRTV